jgi:hypothetical protein
VGSSEKVYRWRKSSHSGGSGECVELARAGAVRDSKNPSGPILTLTDLPAFIDAVRARRFDR